MKVSRSCLRLCLIPQEVVSRVQCYQAPTQRWGSPLPSQSRSWQLECLEPSGWEVMSELFLLGNSVVLKKSILILPLSVSSVVGLAMVSCHPHRKRQKSQLSEHTGAQFRKLGYSSHQPGTSTPWTMFGQQYFIHYSGGKENKSSKESNNHLYSITQQLKQKWKEKSPKIRK